MFYYVIFHFSRECKKANFSINQPKEIKIHKYKHTGQKWIKVQHIGNKPDENPTNLKQHHQPRSRFITIFRSSSTILFHSCTYENLFVIGGRVHISNYSKNRALKFT